MTLRSINPATEEVLATFEEATPDEVDHALERSVEAFHSWRRSSLGDRARLLREMAAHLRRNKERLVALDTAEMGKPIGESGAEVEKCAWACDFYAEHGEEFITPRRVPTDGNESYVAFQPLGPILAIMPWNFPFWQVFRFAAPTVMAGNTVVLKHSSNVPQCGMAIQEGFQAVGFPEGVFQNVPLAGAAVEPLIRDDRIRAVTLTGSDATGAGVAEAAGRAVKKTVLELGGSDPFIVLEDADLEVAARIGASSRARNAGQSCNAAKRFLVVDAVAREFESRFVEALGAMRVGDPAEPETEVGPLARADLREHLDNQVRRSVEMGARAVLGGHRLERPGYFYAPTVLTEVTPDMPAFREETFGPVAAVVRVRDAGQAVKLANLSPYGLGASIWTRDIDRAMALAPEIEAGSVFVNRMVTSDPRLPFGGVKRSGYGRELSEFGMREFVNVQAISIARERPATAMAPSVE